MIAFDYSSVLQRIWLEVVDRANRYIQETEPFKLAKTDLEACRPCCSTWPSGCGSRPS